MNNPTTRRAVIYSDSQLKFQIFQAGLTRQVGTSRWVWVFSPEGIYHYARPVRFNRKIINFAMNNIW